MEFPWRCNVDTIAMDLKVSWEMSVKKSQWTTYRFRFDHEGGNMAASHNGNEAT